MKKIYLDYAATTPVDPRVLKAMTPYFSKKFGNSMSLHSFGHEAAEALENSRITIASLIKAQPDEIVFTSSATESNNFVLKGLAFANKEKNHLIISRIEHDCVLESGRWLKRQGYKLTELPVDNQGFVDLDTFKKAINEKTFLVSIIFANNEMGTIQNVKEIGRICHEKGVIFHTDASQALGKVEIDVKRMGIDMLTGSSQKIYGPKGIAFLYIKSGIFIEPLLHGGGHENGKRSSTSNVAGAVGMAKACEILQKEMDRENKKFTLLRDKLINGILKKIPATRLNGAQGDKRLSNNVNISFAGVEGESLILELDFHGIAASTGSACSSRTLMPSHVLTAIGLNHQQAHGSLRLSIGRFTKEEDINKTIEVLEKVVKKLRAISPLIVAN